jgi:hypothetical protein
VWEEDERKALQRPLKLIERKFCGRQYILTNEFVFVVIALLALSLSLSVFETTEQIQTPSNNFEDKTMVTISSH